MSVIEIETFKLAAATSESDFLAVDQRAQTEFYYVQPGLVRRTTGRGSEGEWIVVTLWSSSAAADDALAVRDEHPAVTSLQRLLATGSVQTRRFTTLD